ncbi:MAG: type II secretion system F family protein [Chloroflexales bacterium]
MDKLLSPDKLPITLAGAGLVLILVLAVVWFVLRKPRDADVSQRLTELAGRTDGAPNEPAAKQAMERIDAVVSKSKRGGDLARDLARADLKFTVAEFMGVKLLTAVVGFFVGLYIGRADARAMIAAGLVGAVIFSFVPNMYMGSRAKGRVKSFNDQLGDTISMMANALRGGFSFLQTLDMVARDAPAPMSAEFRRVVQEVGLGRSTEEALQSLLRRMPSEDLDLLITAVNIQMEVGGNLAQILDTIGHTIRERVRIKGEVQTLTAQGRISGWVITALPVGLAIFITVVNPGYMAPIFTFGMPPESWCCLPVASIVMIVIGFFTIMKIMDIEV